MSMTKRLKGKPNRTTTVTTGEASQILQVAPRTIAKWCDKGDLLSHRLPSASESPAKAGHRHILITDLIAFAKKHGLPLALVAAFGRAYLAGRHWPEGTPEAFGGSASFVPSLFELGMALPEVKGRIRLALCALSFGRDEVLRAGQLLRQKHPNALIVGCAAEDDSVTLTWTEHGFSTVLFRPFDAVSLAEVMA